MYTSRTRGHPSIYPKTLIFLVLLGFLFFVPFAYSYDLEIDFRDTTTNYNRSHTIMPYERTPFYIKTLNSSIVNINYNLNNDLVKTIRFSACSYLNESTAILDGGNIVLDNQRGLHADGISCSSATGVSGICLIVNLNHTYVIGSLSNYSISSSGILDSQDTHALGLFNNNVFSLGINSDSNTWFLVNENDKSTALGTGYTNKTFNQLVFYMAGDAASDQANFNITNVTITNLIDYSGNYLPSFNVSFTKACVNNSNSITNTTYNISIYDAEGDTIYINPLSTSISNLNEQKEVYYNINTGLFPTKDLRFYNSVYKNPTGCNYNFEDFFNQSSFNLITQAADGYWIDPYMLRLSSGCTGIPEYIYQLDRDYTSLLYETRIYDLMDVNEQINISFLDSTMEEQFRVIFKGKNTSNVEIYYFNGTNESYVRYIDYYNPLDIVIQDSGALNISLIHPEGLATLYKYNNSLTRYIKITIDQGAVFQQYFKYKGSYPTNNYTSSATTGNLLLGYGTNYFDFYVTDSVHLGSADVMQSYSIFVDYCKYTNMETTNPEIISTSEIKPFFFFDTTLGRSMINFLVTMEVYELGKTAIYWIFLGMLLFIVITEYFALGNLDLTFALLGSSFSCGFVALIIGYVVPLIVFTIFFAMSIATIMAPLFIGGNKDV